MGMGMGIILLGMRIAYFIGEKNKILIHIHRNMQWQSDKRWTVNSDRQW